MSSKMLCMLVRVAIIAVVFCGLLIFGFLIPIEAYGFAASNPDLAFWRWPWLIFLWSVSLPFFAVLAYAWKVSTAIRQDRVFTLQTAKWVKNGAFLTFADIGLFILGNAVFAVLDMSGPPIVMMSLVVIIIGSALGVCAAVLSRYITKAAELQEDNEGTI